MALPKLANNLVNGTLLACHWATARPCGNTVSLQPLVLSWMRPLVPLAHLSLGVATVLLLLHRPPVSPLLLHPTHPLPASRHLLPPLLLQQ